MYNIAFVCTGNTCRSPMAAAIAKHIYKKYPDVMFFSRGLAVSFPSRASENSVLAVEQLYGANINSHISKQITQEDVNVSNLIITMAESHKRYIKRVFGASGKRVFTLKEAGGLTGDIHDPYGCDLLIYRHCAEEIRSCMNESFENILNSIRSS